MSLLKTAGILLLAFGGLTAVMYLAQRKLMYFPDAARTLPSAAGLPEAEEVWLDTADGERVIVWHVPVRGANPVVVYFHGNGGALRHRVQRFRALTHDGNGLVALSYRGYGGSSGAPTEAGLLADAEAAYAFATARYAPERVVLWGESLGGGVAVALAAKQTVGRIVLEAAFTSAVDIGASVYWFLPVRLLMKDQFRSDLRIGQVKAPILFLHGTDDNVVPLVYGERLFALANDPKRLVRFPGGGHNDLDAHGAQAVARPFIAEAAR
jgi:fermentation-respiration switch protein FrsA (DUF1100 family)